MKNRLQNIVIALGSIVCLAASWIWADSFLRTSHAYGWISNPDYHGTILPALVFALFATTATLLALLVDSGLSAIAADADARIISRLEKILHAIEDSRFGEGIRGETAIVMMLAIAFNPLSSAAIVLFTAARSVKLSAAAFVKA
jgi:hypothetical protein